MGRHLLVIRMFLASPADVSRERSNVEQIVAEINRTVAPSLGMILELVRWEEMVPGMGRAEELIINQADIEDTDLFIGILWNRFGTPTGRALSGTEEEFDLAHAYWSKNGRPRIMFYFCQRPANLQTEEELKQKSHVIRFRQKIAHLGLIRDFKTPNAFEAALRQDITKHLLAVEEKKTQGRLGQAQCQGAPANGTTGVLSKAVLDGMVLVPKGDFLFGPTASARTIDYAFHIDITPVTNCEYLTFIEETGYFRGDPTPEVRRFLERLRQLAKTRVDHPVTSVSWYDALAYAAWRSKRLPTSLEWEKAARGTDGRLLPWGNEFRIDFCNSAISGFAGTTPVFQYEGGRSPYGCFDMAGNVFEWTNDWVERSRFSDAPNSEKVNRGGSYARPPDHLICSYFESDPPPFRMTDVGFRCVFVPEETP